MAVRRSAVHVFTLLAAAAVPAAVDAQTPPTAADPAPYVGQVTTDRVLVRAGPADTFYATQRLNKGDQVTVVGVRGDGTWLKIVPPSGAFCYVAQEHVDRVPGSASAGRINCGDRGQSVRAGSSLNKQYIYVLSTLAKGDPVQIIGDDPVTIPDNKGVDRLWYKIVPPDGAFLYVSKQYVAAVPGAVAPPVADLNDHGGPIASAPLQPATPADPVPPVQAPATSAPTVAVAPPPPPATATADQEVLVPAVPARVAPPTVAVSAAPTPPPVVPPMVRATPVAEQPATRPATDARATVAAASIAVPTTRPAAIAIVRPATRPAMAELPPRQRFEMAEADFARADLLPLDKQPLDNLRWRYRTLAANAALPPSLRQTAAVRVAALDARITARNQQRAEAADAVAAADRLRGLQAEHDAAAERLKARAIASYAAVGLLRVSTLQQPGTTLYRLIDPRTFRTVVYVRTTDPKFNGLLEKFVGVRGPVTGDSSADMRYITPTGVDVIDPTKVGTGVTAAIVPPSMLVQSPAPAAN